MINIIAGLDIGNGYVKGLTNANKSEKNIPVDIPSCVATVPNPTDLPTTNVKEEIDEIFDRANLSFESPLVTGIFGKTRAYLGRRGVQSGKPVSTFNLQANRSKAKQPLSAVLVLSIIASAALKAYYAENKSLPTEILKVNSKVSLALPINEFRDHRDSYADGFMKNSHIVCFHNFDIPVRVEIKFTKVFVTAEGASAQIAIVSKGEAFMNALLADVRKNGIKLDGITAADIINASGTLGIDIGEGTVNFPVFTGTHFNTDFSASLAQGYGTVLENSLEPLRAAHSVFNNRKALSEFLLAGSNPLRQSAYDSAVSIVNSEAMMLVEAIVKEFTNILSQAGRAIDVVYVYGGGASPIRELLYPELISASEEFSQSGNGLPIMYLDSRYSRVLNREGLFQLAMTK